MAARGLFSRIKLRLRRSGTKADKQSLYGVPVKTANWLPVNTGAVIYNGIDVIARLDSTNTTKYAKTQIKKPQMVTFHTGVTPDLAKWRLSQQDTRSTKKPAKTTKRMLKPAPKEANKI